MPQVKCLVIAGAQSGVGKTTITAGLLYALTRQGLRVQSFKTGPDYIDPQCHRWATGRPGYNLDTYLMSPAQVRERFQTATRGADLAVIEGVMGLYDGMSGDSEIGSTAYLAKLLGAPVILVIDASASARSAAAVALGFKMLDPQVDLAGVICNNVGGPAHAEMLRQALESVGIPMVGALRREVGLNVPEDRLGLALPGGENMLPDWIAEAGEAVGSQLNLKALVSDVARPVSAADVVAPWPPAGPAEANGLRIGVGLDEAFWFYYEDTFDLMRAWGAEPVFFQPLTDEHLPKGIDGLYLGGGFPERHAAALAANRQMRESIARVAKQGLPIYAECGGYLYLLDGLSGEDGELYRMCGVIPGEARIQPNLQGFGYRVVDERTRGHLFHYTRVEGPEVPPAWELYRPGGEFERADGYRSGNVTASYLHIHHATSPGPLEVFLRDCGRRRHVGTGRID